MSAEGGRHRLGLVAVTALSLFGALFARLWFLQIVEGTTFDAQVSRNITRTVNIPAPRGRILDRSGTVLVDNRQSTVVAIDTQKFTDLGVKKGKAMLADLAHALSADRPPDQAVTVEFLAKRLNDSRFDRLRPVPVLEDASPQDEVYLREQADRFPTVSVQREAFRRYHFGSLAAHVLGYVGPLADGQWNNPETGFKKRNDASKPYVQTDDIGKAGVEQTYEHDLRGTPGRRVYQVDRRNRVVGELRAERIDPRPGDDLYLSLDAKVQYKAEAALQGRLFAARKPNFPAPAGGVVVLDPQTGQVRAMASYPTYNPAELVGGIACPVWRDLQGLDRNGSCQNIDAELKARPRNDQPVSKLINRATQGAYPPASTFKLATSYAALKLNLITPDQSINDPGSVNICGGRPGPSCVKQNAKGQPTGSVDLRSAITVSSDVYFYKLGADAWGRRDSIGPTALQDQLEKLGYGTKTGIDLPAESPGLMPTPDKELQTATALYKANPGAYRGDLKQALAQGRWTVGFSADLAIGQRVLATPLQIANAYAAFANSGTLWTPSVLDHITRGGRPDQVVRAFKAVPIRSIDWGPARQSMLQGFEGVVDPSASTRVGTAQTPFKGFPFASFPLAGKTGTAQTGKDSNGRERPDNSVFTGFQATPDSRWVATAMLEQSGFGADAAAPSVRLILEPIATGAINTFQIPPDGAIDAKAVAAASSSIATGGHD
jgi:penicillin-binding protein 2